MERPSVYQALILLNYGGLAQKGRRRVAKGDCDGGIRKGGLRKYTRIGKVWSNPRV